MACVSMRIPSTLRPPCQPLLLLVLPALMAPCLRLVLLLPSMQGGQAWKQVLLANGEMGNSHGTVVVEVVVVVMAMAVAVAL